MSGPVVTPGPDYINFSWRELKLRVMVEHFTDDGYAELTVYSNNGTGEAPPQQMRVNLLSTPAVHSLVKRLEKHSANIDWADVVDHITIKTLEIARRGEPTQEIWPSEDDNLTPSYLLEPILYLNHPAVIFGDYGSLKSLLSLVIAYAVQLPYTDNDLGLITATESAKVLYADYEDDKDSFRRRLSALSRGLGIAPMPILYRRMTTPLADAVGELRRIKSDNDIKLLIVDSLGPGAGGNLNDAEPAIRYHSALRQLELTSLTLAHTSKDQLTKRRSIFGSVFFTNLSRSVWEIKAEQEAEDNEALVSLKHVKANLSRKHPPLGYRFTFTDNSISIARADLRDTGLSGELPLAWQIKNLLKRGSFTTKEISEQLNSGADTIGRTLRRMRTKNQVVKLEGDTWGLCL